MSSATLRFVSRGGIWQRMDGDRNARTGAEKLTREERLAAKLRENLHRRKAQAREVARGGRDGAGDDGPDGESGRLPKTPPES